jgi:hypothetical protein
MNRATLMLRGFASAAVLAIVLPTQAMSQETLRAGVVTTLQGTVSVARTTESRPLKFKDDIFVQDRITTGEASIVRILLGGKAVVTVRERSVLTISETATTATVEVGSGKVAIAVAKERMRAGDSVEVKTPNAVAGIRGTVLIAEVTQDGPKSFNTVFTLLTGIVDVSSLDAATGRVIGSRVMLQPLQTLSVTGFTRPTAPRNISRADAQAVASAYKVTIPTPPPAANAPMVERQVEQGVAAAAALLPVDPNAKGETKDAPAPDVAVDDRADKADKTDKADKSGKDKKVATPGSGNAGGGREASPAPTVSAAAPAPAPSAPAPAAPTPAPVPTVPASTPPPVAATPPPTVTPPTVVVSPPPTVTPPSVVPPVANLIDDVTKKLPKLPKAPKPR